MLDRDERDTLRQIEWQIAAGGTPASALVVAVLAAGLWWLRRCRISQEP